MEELWPAGSEAAQQILHRFVSQKYRVGQLDASPLNKGGVTVLGKGAMAGKGKNETRLGRYHQDRDMADRDSSSRISPYLSSGVISIRELIRETMRFLGVKKVDVSRDNGAGCWVTELGECCYSFDTMYADMLHWKAGVTSIHMCSLRFLTSRWVDRSRRNMRISNGKPISPNSRPGEMGRQVIPSLTQYVSTYASSFSHLTHCTTVNAATKEPWYEEFFQYPQILTPA